MQLATQIAGIFGFLGVALGAFGAHQLAGLLTANQTSSIWQTAVLYHLIHASAALWAGDRNPMIVWIWVAGILLLLRIALSPRRNQHPLAWRNHAHRRVVISRGLAAHHHQASMIAKHERISIRTRGKGTYEITEEVSKFVRQSHISTGTVTVFIRHTSASLVIFETPTRAPGPTCMITSKD